MSEAEERLSQTEDSDNTSGVVLGYWDHEKTPNLIQDLERSVNLVELKCKKLLKELTQYKEFLEKPREIDHNSAVPKKKNKNLKISLLNSGSLPEITFRKNLMHFHKTIQSFEEKFKEKLQKINKELAEAAQKIGFNSSVILLPVNDYLKKLLEQPEYIELAEKNEEKEEVEEDVAKEEVIKVGALKDKAKSDSVISENYDGFDFSRITQNQLELYQKLSRLSIKHRSSKKLKSKRKKMKFFLRKKTLKYRPQFASQSPDKNITKRRKNNISVPVKSRSNISDDSDSTMHSKSVKMNKMENVTAENEKKPSEEQTQPKPKFTGSIGASIRKVMPFTVCTSTSRSYNIGFNMQQLLSLPKYGWKANVKISASEKMHGNSRKTNMEGLIPKSEIAVKKRRSTPWSHSPVKNKEEKKDWISEVVNTSNYRKVRSKATERSPNGVFEYLKSTTSRFTNGQKSMIQSKSKAAYAVGSKIMVSDCQRTDIFEIEKSSFKNGSGDGKGNDTCAELNAEWTKVYDSFMKIYRKYTELKEKVSSSDSAYTNEELKSLEKDIDISIEKYKEFLQFYTKFLHLNHRLKSLKIACETKTFEPLTSFSSNCRRKTWSYKTTHSMTMKEAFREVQALQAKISLVYD